MFRSSIWTLEDSKTASSERGQLLALTVDHYAESVAGRGMSLKLFVLKFLFSHESGHSFRILRAFLIEEQKIVKKVLAGSLKKGGTK